MSKPRVDPSLAKRFRTGRVSLDFAHTGGTGEWTEPELIDNEPGLRRWLAHILGLAGVRATADDVAAALELREAVWRLAHARISGRRFEAKDVGTLNGFSAAPPPVPELTADGALAPAAADASAALSAIARDAVDLFAGPLGHRIRVCAADDCALLFVDASRPGTRRWCSMERCGNLAKLRTHRETKPVVSSAG